MLYAKKTDAKYAENKIKQRITVQSKEKSPKKIADQKKYFLGDLLQKWMNSRYSNLNDSQILDVLKDMIDNEKIGAEFKQYSLQNNKNIEFINEKTREVESIKQMIDTAQSDPRNPLPPLD